MILCAYCKHVAGFKSNSLVVALERGNYRVNDFVHHDSLGIFDAGSGYFRQYVQGLSDQLTMAVLISHSV
jgi:hypothetical protein